MANDDFGEMARKVRRQVDNTRSPDMKAALLKIAEQYESIASEDARSNDEPEIASRAKGDA